MLDGRLDIEMKNVCSGTAVAHAWSWMSPATFFFAGSPTSDLEAADKERFQQVALTGEDQDIVFVLVIAGACEPDERPTLNEW